MYRNLLPFFSKMPPVPKTLRFEGELPVLSTAIDCLDSTLSVLLFALTAACLIFMLLVHTDGLRRDCVRGYDPPYALYAIYRVPGPIPSLLFSRSTSSSKSRRSTWSRLPNRV